MENEEYENWNDLFADLQVPDDVTLFTSDGETLIDPPCTDSSWIIGDIESMLMKDDDDSNKNGPIIVTDGISIDEFLSDLLVNSPGEKTTSNDESVKSTESGTEKDIEKVCYTPEVNVDDDNDSVAIDDPVSNKKQRRQLRNRDAAVRSRERKKMYVKDLEVKSKYLEGECRRLGRMLQCVVAENHALRYSLQCSNAHGAPLTKQESAVLMLESLLLGSLLWFVGVMCLFNPLTLPRSEIPLENVEKKDFLSRVARETENEVIISSPLKSVLKSRRCRGSRTRMRRHLIEVIA